MKLYRVTHVNGVCGVDGMGSPDLNLGDEAEMTDLQARARIGKIVEVDEDAEMELEAERIRSEDDARKAKDEAKKAEKHKADKKGGKKGGKRKG